MDKSQGYSSEVEFGSQVSHEENCQCEEHDHVLSAFPTGMSPKLIEVLIQQAKRKQNLAKKNQGKKKR